MAGNGKKILSTGGPTKKIIQMMAGGRMTGAAPVHPVVLQGVAGSLMRLNPHSPVPQWSDERYLGEPIPEHLKPRPTTGHMAQYYKRQMSLVRQCQNLAPERHQTSPSEEAGAEPAMATTPTSPDVDGDTSSSEMSVTAPRGARSMSNRKHGPRTVGRHPSHP